MTNGRPTHGIPIWFLSSGPEMPSVDGMNLFFPPILFHSSFPSVTKALVEYAVGVIVVPTAYTSGPVPDTTDVWILVISSLADANVSHLSVAPVCVLNLSATDFCQVACCCGYCVFAAISTSRVLPPPPLPPPESSPPPQAASAAVSAAAPRTARADRVVLTLISISLGRLCRCGVRAVTARGSDEMVSLLIDQLQ